MSGRITVIGLIVAVLGLGLLVITPVVHAPNQNETTPSVKLNALLKINSHPPYRDTLEYNIQPPAKFVFSPSFGPSNGDIKITSPSELRLFLFNDGTVSLVGQAHVTAKNAMVSTTRLTDLLGTFHFDRVDHNKVTGATTYHITPGSFNLGKMRWSNSNPNSNATLSVKTFDNGTGVLSLLGFGGSGNSSL